MTLIPGPDLHQHHLEERYGVQTAPIVLGYVDQCGRPSRQKYNQGGKRSEKTLLVERSQIPRLAISNPRRSAISIGPQRSHTQFQVDPPVPSWIGSFRSLLRSDRTKCPLQTIHPHRTGALLAHVSRPTGHRVTNPETRDAPLSPLDTPLEPAEMSAGQ